MSHQQQNTAQVLADLKGLLKAHAEHCPLQRAGDQCEVEEVILAAAAEIQALSDLLAAVLEDRQDA